MRPGLELGYAKPVGDRGEHEHVGLLVNLAELVRQLRAEHAIRQRKWLGELRFWQPVAWQCQETVR